MLLSMPPLKARLAAGRPVLARDQMHDLTRRIMALTTAPQVDVKITHTARVVTRLARGQVLTSDDGDTLKIRVGVGFTGATGQKGGYVSTTLQTNQLDVNVLRPIIAQCEAIARDKLRSENPNPMQPTVQDTYVPVQLWHGETIDAMRQGRATVVDQLLRPVRQAGLAAAGFVGLMARSETYVNREGITAYCEDTDCEVTVTARGANQQSGWGGSAARNWTKVDIAEVTRQAVETAKQSANPVAVEPGRRTAILGPAAMGQIARAMAGQFNDRSQSGFEVNRKIRWNSRYFDPRITISSDPADPDGGYRPFFDRGGYATPAMTWIDQGILKNLANPPDFALMQGKPYVETPYSMRIAGGPTSVTEMIAGCEEGIYVNRFASLEIVDNHTGLMTGVTRDGCFLIKHGKIAKAVKNFRIRESPFFFLNKLQAIGPTHRVALGFVPNPRGFEWPLPPVIVPPVMAQDFNFSALSDAV
jgi:predicted Zn-dependent protease